MTIKRVFSIAASALAGALVASSPAPAEELIYGSWLPAGEYINRVSLPKVFATIAKDTNGAITWKLVPGGQLADPKATFEAVKSGLMAGGMGISSYVPNLIPSLNTIYSTVIFGDDVVAASGAAVETATLNCPSCIAEYKKINAVALSGWTSSPYYLTCREPVRSLADLKGKRVRATAGYVELLRLADAVPVAATLVEAVGLLQRGGLECQFGVYGWLKIFGYADFIKNVTDHPLGMTGPPIGMMLNRDVWNKMTPEQKKIHLKAASYVSADLALGQFVIENDEIFKELQRTKGLSIVKANKQEFDALVSKYEPVMRQRNIDNAKQFGVPDPAAIIDAYAAARKKWAVLSKGIGRDIDKFAAAIQREIYDKVDPNKM
ncbi:MAG: TRAP transporter substrate-binding protein DctP [Betaproteobacteria bacterium]|nr:TRAP transporter substrate-binding protein DctP [Betaproteobacteria bacterium]